MKKVLSEFRLDAQASMFLSTSNFCQGPGAVAKTACVKKFNVKILDSGARLPQHVRHIALGTVRGDYKVPTV
jgi:hypothetical protein